MKRWNVLLTEPIHPAGTAVLEPFADWRIATRPDPETLRREIADADALVVRAYGYVDAALMDAAPRLKVIARHGVGVDNVDVSAATERGIWVVHTPNANAEAVAEHVIGVLLAFARKLFEADAGLRRGDWSIRNRDYGFELLDKTLGIVGLGRIGRRVAEIARRAFSMRVLYTDVVRNSAAEAELDVHYVPLGRLLAESDFVTVHVPATPQTVGLFNRKRFFQMKRGAYFINAARGKIHVEADLIEALQSGHLAGAALDVFEQEPLPLDSPLLQLPNLILTPHKAGQSDASMRRMALVTEDVLRILRGELPRHPVNRPPHPRARLQSPEATQRKGRPSRV